MQSDSTHLYDIKTHAHGPQGKLPLTDQMLRHSPSGNLFGLSQNVGMGWKASDLTGKQVLLLSTQGGMKDADGSPIALGYHTGHWEVDLLMKEAAKEVIRHRGIPFAAYVSDPCDGRTQGTEGMFDSFPYRNDAATVYRRLIRSLPTREAVIGIGTCDKGLPAMMIALASMHDLPTVVIPGGVTLPPTYGEDAAKIQTIGARYSNNELSLEEASELGCRTCATSGGGCQFLGTAATAQVVSEALGLSVPHSALAPSGQEVWLEMAKQSARAVLALEDEGLKTKDIITNASIRNAMIIHAAFGGSTNLLLHIPAIAHAAGCNIPTAEDWDEINRKTPRLVSVLPNGPDYHPTIRAFLAGGVPEVMLYLRPLGLLDEDVMTVTGKTLRENLDWWEQSERRVKMKERLKEADGLDADQIIMSPDQAEIRGLTSTITFPKGNIAPDGAVIKSTSIDSERLDEHGVYYHKAEAKVFTSERDAIEAIKSGAIVKGDIMVLTGCGPLGTGMEETYQVTSALKHLSYGKYVTLLTDARFSGVSTGACIGHIGPEGLADGPIGKLQTSDVIEVRIDAMNLSGDINFLGTTAHPVSAEDGARILEARETNAEIKPSPGLPDDTRLWAALQKVSGGTWRGSVYDVDRIIKVLEAGEKVLDKEVIEKN
ncbi:YjhG/YagF family D-xylonate dehydratase [Aquibacillus koreensis]|uniref:YjhG/YagF family D-xylonate dehydratase n=2 Tax=Aquibacillus koreensis TaxID=279446 RepID=A0A9X4ALD7_9BACI|nr:YjhG/YagF family D-xylonate dehydratase [Aquibacillus koreensis]MCT2537011.1 YjhG/YagF family D-xylonate dehydratase [Aquibacillus koreensis]MDC3422335.1 YjhG/YagF family D-xylonate dehydratase [Aquibacillus koreensis]